MNPQTVVDKEPGQHDAAWLRGLFLGELVDLGEKAGAPYAGIFSPGYDAKEITRFMTDHYASLEGAQVQADTINMYDFYYQGIQEAMTSAGFCRAKDKIAALEICAGFGSATLPMLDIFPNALLCATEFSAPMLTFLKKKLEKAGHEKRCVLMQLNAEELSFVPESFDLIVGGAALHHLFHPDKTLEQCARILKPGGVAIFFEPFENGMGIIKMLFKAALKDPRSYLFGIRTRLYMLNCVRYWQKMISPDKTHVFAGADDKWLFSKQYFSDLAQRNGMECTIYPVDKSSRPFEALVRVHTAGNGFKNLPKWFWRIVDDFEKSFSDDLKKDLLTEGVVIFRKPLNPVS